MASNVEPNVKNSLSNDSDFIIASLNVRSLLPKIDEINLLVNKHSFSILLLNETWLDSSVLNSECNIDGYSIERHDRNRHGGGVGFYIRNSIKYAVLPELNVHNILSS